MKKLQCPQPGSKSIAKIFHGLPDYSETFNREMEEGRIALGGCCISSDSPRSECNECGKKRGKVNQKGVYRLSFQTIERQMLFRQGHGKRLWKSTRELFRSAAQQKLFEFESSPKPERPKATLRAAFNTALRWKLIEENPLEEISLLRVSNREPK